MAAIQLTTYKDLEDHLQDYVGALNDQAALRDAGSTTGNSAA
jgi:hypothetical protein